jgi:hypothetical protein
MPTLGLCMIVKNEAGVITRCLDSVRPLLDYVLIEDTGSTDGTQQAVADWLADAGIPGVVIEEPWRDFAWNRSHALARLRQVKEIDYVLMVDAGDVVVLEPGFDVAAFKAGLRCDVMEAQVRQGELRWLRPQIGSNRAAIALKGVVFEGLDDSRPLSVAAAQGLHVQSSQEGVRNRNPAKHREDAALLEQALQGEADPHLAARYRFYLAQSYRDAGETEKARAAYLARAALGGCREAVFCSLYEAARLDEALGAPADQVLARYARAAEAAPARAEVNYEAARICVREGRFEEGYQCAKGGLGKPAPVDGLFVRMDVYEYRLLDVFAAAALATGRWAEGEAACERLLAEGRAPSDQRERIAGIQAQAAERRRVAAVAAPGGSDPFLNLLRSGRRRRSRGAPSPSWPPMRRRARPPRTAPKPCTGRPPSAGPTAGSKRGANSP